MAEDYLGRVVKRKWILNSTVFYQWDPGGLIIVQVTKTPRVLTGIH